MSNVEGNANGDIADGFIVEGVIENGWYGDGGMEDEDGVEEDAAVLDELVTVEGYYGDFWISLLKNMFIFIFF